MSMIFLWLPWAVIGHLRPILNIMTGLTCFSTGPLANRVTRQPTMLVVLATTSEILGLLLKLSRMYVLAPTIYTALNPS